MRHYCLLFFFLLALCGSLRFYVCFFLSITVPFAVVEIVIMEVYPIRHLVSLCSHKLKRLQH